MIITTIINKKSLLGGFLALLAGASQSGILPELKPNIIVILADDMGYSDIGCYGSEISTPNIDRLAREGVRFTQFYNTARCCPSRASLLTGMYHHKTGVGAMTKDMGIPAYQGYLNRECMTIGEMLKEGGYKTFLSGKWHVGDKEESWPANRGFDRSFSLIVGAADYFDPYNGKFETTKMVIDNKKFIPLATNFYMTDAITDHAFDFIKDHDNKDGNAPFFLYLAYTAPHWPLQAPVKDIEQYKDVYKVGWDSIRAQRYRRMKNLGIVDQDVKLSERNETVPAWDSLSSDEKENWARKMAVYAGMIDHMDQGIGKLLNLLETKGMAQNTLVVFLSDNGGCMEEARKFGKSIPGSVPGGPGSFISYEANWANVSDTPFRYFKHWMHEGGTSTPFIACFPGTIFPGSIKHAPAHIIDLAPTFLELTGLTYSGVYKGHQMKELDGKSLLPILKGADVSQHKLLFWEHLGFRAVRMGDWKIVSTYPENKWELYNLKTDRSEENDLSSQYPQKVKELNKYYGQWAKKSEVMPWKEVLNSQRQKRE